METDPSDRLRLVQWLSPAFPIGGFAYSQGLEAAITTGDIATSADLQAWISAVLTHGSARSDAVLLAHARGQGADISGLADLCLAMAASAERVTELTEQGRAFALAITAITGVDIPELPYPIAVGLATASLRVETSEVLTLWMQGLAAQLTYAAVRFVPLGQTEGQAVLARLAPQIVALAEVYATTPLDEISSTSPRADLAAMRHETMDVRIFRT